MSELSRYQDTPIGPYHLSRLLGVGPVSRVYLAERQDWPGRQVALKLFEAVPLHVLEEKDQALDEVRLLACIEHPAILPMLDDGLHEDMLYLVMPYVRGDTLRQHLTASAGQPLPSQEALTSLRQIGEALHFAHTQQIVHANLKPENILFQEHGRVLLADFLLPSLVKSERAARILSTFAALYMAPEQFRGLATPLSDQYSLACLAYEMLTGHAPFEADDAMSLARQHATKEPKPPSELQPSCEPHIDHALLKALVKRPEGRFPDILTFLAELRVTPLPMVLVSTQEMVPTAASSQTSAPNPVLVEAAGLSAQQILPEQDGVFERETVKQPALKAVSAAVVTGMYEAVTTAMRAARPRPLVAEMSVVPVLSQQTLAPAHTRTLPRLSRRQTWLTACLTILVMLVSISGLVLFLNASASQHQPPTRKGGVALAFSPTPTAGQSSPAATTAGAATSSSPTATATATPSPTAIPTPTATPKPTATATPTPAPTPTPTAVPAAILTCKVVYTLSAQWPGSFTANLTITNTGTAVIQNWTLVFTFPNKQQVFNGWNGHFTQNGAQVSITDAGFNGTLKPGTSADPGFQALSHGTNNRPAAFALNGVACQ